MRIGILMHGDPTRDGAILSEVKFLHGLAQLNPQHEYVVLTVNSIAYAKHLAKLSTDYVFCNGIINLWSDNLDYEQLDQLSVVITYPLHNNYFGGLPNNNSVRSYLIISYLTNRGVPVFIRLNDSELLVHDYKKLTQYKLALGNMNKSMQPKHHDWVDSIVECEYWNYEKVYWLANGNRSYYDWVAETLHDKIQPQLRVGDHKTVNANAIYASDDLFFQVNDKYNKCSLNVNNNPEKKFCYIGFFDTINTKRAKAFKDIFGKNEYKLPMKIFGKGTEILTFANAMSNIDVEEGYIAGDSDEFFSFLNRHLAYVFIGKGGKTAKYIGKTVYDAYIARTPVVVCRKFDPEMKIFSNRECYFDTEYGLKRIYEQLLNNDVRKQWVEAQALDIQRALTQADIDFQDYL
jgi:hypothetical protein